MNSPCSAHFSSALLTFPFSPAFSLKVVDIVQLRSALPGTASPSGPQLPNDIVTVAFTVLAIPKMRTSSASRAFHRSQNGGGGGPAGGAGSAGRGTGHR